jgi:pyridoxal phosphate enzyme (YggS family)
MISQKLAEIRNRIAEAAKRARRDPAEITLVAVAKGQPLEKVIEAIAAGVTEIGENYAQEMSAHAGAGLKPAPTWHFIGHLQRNKVKQILDKAALIHSVDSLELAREIDRRAAAVDKVQPILIEVNLGGEKTKTGILPPAAKELAKRARELKHVELRGLMAIPPFLPDPGAVRPYFRELREIRDEIQKEIRYASELSMGMTHDFEVAIEEGATIVRIGTGIFGERTKN